MKKKYIDQTTVVMSNTNQASKFNWGQTDKNFPIQFTHKVGIYREDWDEAILTLKKAGSESLKLHMSDHRLYIEGGNYHHRIKQQLLLCSLDNDSEFRGSQYLSISYLDKIRLSMRDHKAKSVYVEMLSNPKENQTPRMTAYPVKISYGDVWFIIAPTYKDEKRDYEE